MSKQKDQDNDDRPRRGRARAAGDLLGDIGGAAFKRFGFVQARRQPLGRDRRRALRQGVLPESIRFPPGKKSGGTLTLLVEGAHAPLIQHLAPMIIERVNRFFGYEAIDRIVFRQGRCRRRRPSASPRRQPAAGAERARRGPARRSPIPSFGLASHRLPGISPRQRPAGVDAPARRTHSHHSEPAQ